MAKYNGLPGDFAVEALAMEADRRHRQIRRPYSYGKLVAETTEAERREIVNAYRKRRSRRAEAPCFTRKKDQEEKAVRKILARQEKEGEDDGTVSV